MPKVNLIVYTAFEGRPHVVLQRKNPFSFSRLKPIDPQDVPFLALTVEGSTLCDDDDSSAYQAILREVKDKLGQVFHDHAVFRRLGESDIILRLDHVGDTIYFIANINAGLLASFRLYPDSGGLRLIDLDNIDQLEKSGQIKSEEVTLIKKGFVRLKQLKDSGLI